MVDNLEACAERRVRLDLAKPATAAPCSRRKWAEEWPLGKLTEAEVSTLFPILRESVSLPIKDLCIGLKVPPVQAVITHESSEKARNE